MNHIFFTDAYLAHLRAVFFGGDNVLVRGQCIRELTFVNWTLLDVRNSHIDWSYTSFPERQPVYHSYAQKEQSWYLTGDRRANRAPSEFWLKLANKDGLINSNYGHLVLKERKYPGSLCAYEHVVQLLMADRQSRQAVMHYNRPSHYLNQSKDIPCTLTAQVVIRNNKLSMIVSQRSCDLWFGMPYDVPWHCYLIRSLARDLGVETGFFHHSIGSLHIYERDFDRVRRTLGVATTPAV